MTIAKTVTLTALEARRQPGGRPYTQATFLPEIGHEFVLIVSADEYKYLKGHVGETFALTISLTH